MTVFRRDFLKLAGASLAGATAIPGASLGLQAQTATTPGTATAAVIDVRAYGARGDGASIDTAAINKAIDAASAQGGGTVRFPAGTYASYSIHLKSNVLRQAAAAAAPPTTPPSRIRPGKIIRIMATIIGTIASSGVKASTTSPFLGPD
jgi:hypothetical protein